MYTPAPSPRTGRDGRRACRGLANGSTAHLRTGAHGCMDGGALMYDVRRQASQPGHLQLRARRDVTAGQARATSGCVCCLVCLVRSAAPNLWPAHRPPMRQRRVHNRLGRCQRVRCLPAVAADALPARCLFSRVEPDRQALRARWDQANLMPTCHLTFQHPWTHELLRF